LCDGRHLVYTSASLHQPEDLLFVAVFTYSLNHCAPTSEVHYLSIHNIDLQSVPTVSTSSCISIRIYQDDMVSLPYTTYLILATTVLLNLYLPLKVVPRQCHHTTNDMNMYGSLPVKMVWDMKTLSFQRKPHLLGNAKQNRHFMLYISLLLLGNSGDVEPNPGPQAAANQTDDASTAYLCGGCKEQVTWEREKERERVI